MNGSMTDKDKLSREDLRADRAAPPRRARLTGGRKTLPLSVQYRLNALPKGETGEKKVKWQHST